MFAGIDDCFRFVSLLDIFQDFAQPHWLWFPQHTPAFLPVGKVPFPWRRAMPIRATNCAAAASVSFFGGEMYRLFVSICCLESWLVAFWISVSLVQSLCHAARRRRRWKTCKHVMHCECPWRFCKGPWMKVGYGGELQGHDHQMSIERNYIVLGSSRSAV